MLLPRSNHNRHVVLSDISRARRLALLAGAGATALPLRRSRTEYSLVDRQCKVRFGNLKVILDSVDTLKTIELSINHAHYKIKMITVPSILSRTLPAHIETLSRQVCAQQHFHLRARGANALATLRWY